MTALALKGLCKHYELPGKRVVALAGIDLAVAAGSFVTIVGRSGCGKTTLLRIIGGLERQTAGEVAFSPPAARVGMVFQEPRLMPWLTVEQNMALAMRHKEPEEIKQAVGHHLEMLGLSSFRDAYPAQISGGMAQRVALGRALCFSADIILMDEPLSALDAFTRRNLQEELVNIFQKYGKTIIFVTHDIDEALILGQRVLVMESGAITRDLAVSFPYPREKTGEAFFRLRESLLDSLQGAI
ncbi:MAG TPA: ABC transporter ATP-binding protein [Negativicutes bacterium]|nr:ABC transporter ATP-binding protein [Negativicutes bacterium]